MRHGILNHSNGNLMRRGMMRFIVRYGARIVRHQGLFLSKCVGEKIDARENVGLFLKVLFLSKCGGQKMVL